MKLIGFRKSDFLSKEGTSITGYTVYLSYPITGDGAGQACDRIYITDAKLAKCGYTPHVGDEVNVPTINSEKWPLSYRWVSKAT